MNLLEGHFYVPLKNLPAVWTHVVLNYVGLEKCEGNHVYKNGCFAAADTTKEWAGHFPGDGRLVIGCSYTTEHRFYTSVKLDELMLFNTILSKVQVLDLSARA